MGTRNLYRIFTGPSFAVQTLTCSGFLNFVTLSRFLLVYHDNIKEKRRGSAEVVRFDYFAGGRVERMVKEAVTPNSQSKNKEAL